MAVTRASPLVLRAALRRHLATTGETIPEGLKLQAVGGVDAVMLVPPAWLPPSRISRLQADSPFEPHSETATREFLDAAAEVCRVVTRLIEREAALADVPGGRYGIEQPGSPAWSVLAHPLALALVLPLMPSRDQPPWMSRSEDNRDITGVHPEGDLLSVNMLRTTIGRSDVTISSFPQAGEGRWGTMLSIMPDPFSATVANALAGERLVDVVEIPPTGHEDVDVAVREVRIAHASQGGIAGIVTMRPVRWIPYAPPPDGVDAGFLHRTPTIA